MSDGKYRDSLLDEVFAKRPVLICGDAVFHLRKDRLSKLLSMIWTHELASTIDSTARGVEIASFTPGASQTQICRDLGTGHIVRIVMNLFCQSAEEGTWTFIRALIAEDYHGRYFFRSALASGAILKRVTLRGNIQ
ncbi:hypothetical protein N7471_013260 [Penicillium samsonianum]|uniref:uncharacterized protein n=1 Tax=Penicillium samsonianum TaxID=1882272 RepID=UPI0025467BDC|nr:uncharacterized protein N7471_013260 [Penicillium samsonianum]KAJ6118640.1 hypothetical protein N7471_013260 [Penicillium samsonianum]